MYILVLVLPVLYYLYVLCQYICKICRKKNIWPFSKTFRSNIRLDGQTAVITGGNCGIGKETALDFYNRGARVLLLCRDQEKAISAINDIKRQCANSKKVGELILKRLDLSNLGSIRACVAEILNEERQINLLINNAGLLCSPTRKTVDGFEMHFGVNYLGHFLLTLLLLPVIIKSRYARIVNVASVVHKFWFYGAKIHFDDLNLEKNFATSTAYFQSKLANVMFTKELAKKLKEFEIKNVTTYSLHPGVIISDLGRNFDDYSRVMSWFWTYCAKWVLKNPLQGAQTTIYCALDEALAKDSGLYYADCAKDTPSSYALDKVACEKLWNITIKLLKLEKYNPFE